MPRSRRGSLILRVAAVGNGKVRNVALMVGALWLTACAYLQKPKDPIPSLTIAAKVPAQRLFVVLPGRGDSLRTLVNTGIAATIQRHLPDADVLLVGATLTYYLDGKLVERLHDQIMRPARARGYREIWLLGASLGGMGATLYEREHPDEAAGLVLLAPYMGEAPLIEEIARAGGVAAWNSGTKPTELNRDNARREQWRVVQSWATDKQRAADVWLVCGDTDRFHDAAELIAPVLPPDHYFVPHGGHKWVVWKEGAEQALAAIAARTFPGVDRSIR